jgi:hypothetical protein
MMTQLGAVPLPVASPALLCCLTGDAEPGADVGPGVAVFAESDHGVPDAGVDSVGRLGHED